MKYRMLLFLPCLILSLMTLQSADAEQVKKERIAVLVFAQEGVDDRLRASIERDLRNMVVLAEGSDKLQGRLYPIEPFYDVGQLSKANLRKAQRHFNNAQRSFEQKDFEEAKDQLFRADRFYLKGVPYIYNGNEELLQSIYYLNYRKK